VPLNHLEQLANGSCWQVANGLLVCIAGGKLEIFRLSALVEQKKPGLK
jgi:hypothetical protein